jgi:hypothetical protein
VMASSVRVEPLICSPRLSREHNHRLYFLFDTGLKFLFVNQPVAPGLAAGGLVRYTVATVGVASPFCTQGRPRSCLGPCGWMRSALAR